MFAKRFFHVCAGLLCLAVAFHLGAVSGHAQTGVTVEGASIQAVQDNTFPRGTGCVDRVFYWISEGGATHQLSVAVPGTEHIVASDPYGTVMLENGDWLQFDGTAWVLIGNLTGGATATHRKTWGDLKARYRVGSEK